MTTLCAGITSYDAFKKLTVDIASKAFVSVADEPKVWFISIESFAKVLSDRNRELLTIIAEAIPGSLTALTKRLGRPISSLSRTLKTMERYDLVRFEEGGGRTQTPRVVYSAITLDVFLRVSLR